MLIKYMWLRNEMMTYRAWRKLSFWNEQENIDLPCSLLFSVSASGLFIMISVFYSKQLSCDEKVLTGLTKGSLSEAVLAGSQAASTPPKTSPPHSSLPTLTSLRALTTSEILTSANEGDAPLRVLLEYWHLIHKYMMDWKFFFLFSLFVIFSERNTKPCSQLLLLLATLKIRFSLKYIFSEYRSQYILKLQH